MVDILLLENDMQIKNSYAILAAKYDLTIYRSALAEEIKKAEYAVKKLSDKKKEITKEIDFLKNAIKKLKK